MSLTNNLAYPYLFESNVDIALQQKASKLRNLITLRNFNGVTKGFTYHNKRAATEIATSSRIQATPSNDISLERYWLTKTELEWTERTDERDQEYFANVAIAGSPQMESALASFNQKIDYKIITAALGNRQIGEIGATADALPAGNIVAVNYVPSGTATAFTSGLTIDKIRRAGYLLDTADVDQNDRVLVIAPLGKMQLLQSAEATNMDYMTKNNLERGYVENFMGFTIVVSNYLPTATSVRSAIAFHKKGLVGAIDSVKAHFDVLPETRHSKQIRATLDCGFTRSENEYVIEIKCSEA